MNSLTNQQSITKREKLCEVCSRKNEEQQAVSWCFGCEEAVCDDCVRTHKAVKALMDHSIVSLDDIKTDQLDPVPAVNILCEEHRNKKLEIYCYDHKVVCCLTCMTAIHRKCDKVTTLEEAAEDIKTRAKDEKFMDRLGSVSAKMKEAAVDRNENIQELEIQKVKIEESITKHRADVNKYFDKLEMRLRNEFNIFHKETVTLLQKQRNQYEHHAKTLEKCYDQMKIHLNHASDLQICLELNSIEKQLVDQELFLKAESNNVHRLYYQFSLDATPEYMRKSIKALGKVTTEDASKRSVSGKSSVPHFIDAFNTDSFIADGKFLPDGRILLADYDSKELKIYDCTGVVQTSFELPFAPFCLTFVQDTTCITSTRNDSSIYFVDPVNNRNIKNISVDDLKARCLTVCRNNIIAASVQDIKMLDQNGSYLKTLANSTGEICSVCPTMDDKILYTDSKLNELHCIDLNGKKIFSYSDKTMVCPTDVNTDNEGNIYLVGRMSHNIQLLSREGKFIKMILTEIDGLHRPDFLAFNKDFTTFLVCCDMDDKYLTKGGPYILLFNMV